MADRKLRSLQTDCKTEFAARAIHNESPGKLYRQRVAYVREYAFIFVSDLMDFNGWTQTFQHLANI